MILPRIVSMSLVLASVAVLAQDAPTSATSLFVVEDSDGFASYLVDQVGRVIYFSLNDREGQSKCSVKCLEDWRPITGAKDLVLGEGIDANAMGNAESTDGSEQLSYFGRPLYVQADPELATTTSAHGTGGLWFLINPAGERAEKSEVSGETGSLDNIDGSGWFTVEQAQRGKSAYESSCAVCHHTSLFGEQYAPALKGAAFLRNWGGESVADLYRFIHERMPLGSPGSLSDQQYIDIVTYILSQNELPPGGTELSPAFEDLTGLSIPGPND